MNPYTFSLALGATGLVVMALGGWDTIVIQTVLAAQLVTKGGLLSGTEDGQQ